MNVNELKKIYIILLVTRPAEYVVGRLGNRELRAHQLFTKYTGENIRGDGRRPSEPTRTTGEGEMLKKLDQLAFNLLTQLRLDKATDIFFARRTTHS